MQTQCDANGVFPATFVKDLKPWLESQVHTHLICAVINFIMARSPFNTPGGTRQPLILKLFNCDWPIFVFYFSRTSPFHLFPLQESLKSNTKGLMQFAAFMRDEAGERGVDALATVLPINQKAILEVNLFFFISFFVLCNCEASFICSCSWFDWNRTSSPSTQTNLNCPHWFWFSFPLYFTSFPFSGESCVRVDGLGPGRDLHQRRRGRGYVSYFCFWAFCFDMFCDRVPASFSPPLQAPVDATYYSWF